MVSLIWRYVLKIVNLCNLSDTEDIIDATLQSKNVRIEDINEHIQLDTTTNKYAGPNDTNHNKCY